MQRQQQDYPVDAVILWVDNSDPEWQKQKESYLGQHKKTREYKQYSGAKSGHAAARYNDMDTLRYVLRSIEKNLPWLNKIYLVTNGTYPDWINKSAEKLVLISHDAFFKNSHDLPTFNTNAIHSNIHRIEGLAEHFILFDDDTIVIRPHKKETFFVKGLPVKNIRLLYILSDQFKSLWDEEVFNNLLMLKKRFKFYTLRGFIIRTLLLSTKIPVKKKIAGLYTILRYSLKRRPFPSIRKNICFYFVGGPHWPNPFLKSVNARMSEEFFKEFEKTSANKFRMADCIIQRGWDQFYIMSNMFYAKNVKSLMVKIDEKTITDLSNTLQKALSDSDCASVCLQDELRDESPERDIFFVKEKTTEILEKIFPIKSAFER